MYNLGFDIFPDINKEDALVQITNKGDRYYHSHNFYELFYITSGTIKHSLNNEIDELSTATRFSCVPGIFIVFCAVPITRARTEILR